MYMKDGDIADLLECYATAIEREAHIAARPGQMEILENIANNLKELAKDVREG